MNENERNAGLDAVDVGARGGSFAGVVEAVESAPDVGRFRFRYDPLATLPSTAVVAALAAVGDCDPVDIDPLFSALDPDALDALVGPVAKSSRRSASVTFRIADYEVAIGPPGEVGIRTVE